MQPGLVQERTSLPAALIMVGREGGWFIRVVGVHVCLTEFSSYLGVFPDIFMILASSLVL